LSESLVSLGIRFFEDLFVSALASIAALIIKSIFLLLPYLFEDLLLPASDTNSVSLLLSALVVVKSLF